MNETHELILEFIIIEFGEVYRTLISSRKTMPTVLAEVSLYPKLLN